MNKYHKDLKCFVSHKNPYFEGKFMSLGFINMFRFGFILCHLNGICVKLYFMHFIHEIDILVNVMDF